MMDAPKNEEAALAAFMEYFRKNYPGPETIIGRPDWHSPKIFRAARHALFTPEALATSPHVQALVKAHEKEIAVWSENYAALERERDKWFEGAGVHHVASMEQAQRADRAMAALASAQQRIKLLCDNDEWNLGLQEALEVVRAEAAAIREVTP